MSTIGIPSSSVNRDASLKSLGRGPAHSGRVHDMRPVPPCCIVSPRRHDAIQPAGSLIITEDVVFEAWLCDSQVVLPSLELSSDSLLSGICSRHHMSQRFVSSRTNPKERVEHEAVEYSIPPLV